MNEYIVKAKAAFWNSLDWLENSQLFEKMVLKYEGLTSDTRSLVNAIATLLLILLILLLLFFPLWNIFVVNPAKLGNFRTITSKSKEIQSLSIPKVQVTNATISGKENMAASSPAQLQTSLDKYTSQKLAISPISKTFNVVGSSLELSIKELTINQANNLIFQIDALHPQAIFKSLKLSINAENKDLLSLDATVDYTKNSYQNVKVDPTKIK